MRFTLNNTYGINGIEKIDLKEIIKAFGEPDERKIERDSEYKNLNISFIYLKLRLEVFYRINYFFEEDLVDFHSLSFIVKELYLEKELKMKSGEDMKQVLSKIEGHHKKLNKEFEFEYEEHEYGGSYDFTNLDITIYFEKEGRIKYLDDIYVDLPYEDNPEVLSLEEILYMK